MHLQIISLDAGVQSTALLVLNALGRVEPRATHAIFADTGGELLSQLANTAGRSLRKTQAGQPAQLLQIGTVAEEDTVLLGQTLRRSRDPTAADKPQSSMGECLGFVEETSDIAHRSWPHLPLQFHQPGLP